MADPNHTLKLAGRITDDPVTALDIGLRLQFSPMMMRPHSTEGLQFVNNWDAFEGSLLAIHFKDAQGEEISGSAVLVAPGVAIAATHVFADRFAALLAGETACILSAISSSGMQFWRPVHIVSLNESDLTIISMTYASPLPRNNTFYQAHMTTRSPRIGEEVMICGFRAERHSVTDGIQGNVLVSTGKVTNVFLARRDSVLLRWPSFEVDCATPGGMSGGPVFDSDGFMLGMLCRSFDGPGGVPMAPSYVSQLWPCMLQSFQPVWPRGLHAVPTSLLAMDRRMCLIERAEALRGNVALEQGGLSIQYAVWETRNPV